MKQDEFVTSSGNVFADLGLENSDEELGKAKLALAVRQRIENKGIDQTEAATLLEADPAELAQLLRGQVGAFTYDRLLRFLNALGVSARIIIEPTADHSRGKTLVTAL